MDFSALRSAIASGNPVIAMPALVALREATAEEAEELLLLGLKQEAFALRSLSCAGLGIKRTPAGRDALVQALKFDNDSNVKAEAANSLVNHGLESAWPLLLEAFETNDQWLIRCSILSAVAEHPEVLTSQLLQLAKLAVADSDGTVRVSGAQILGLIIKQKTVESAAARTELLRLQQDQDHRVVAAVLSGLLN
jgi:HEAT repeat protein